MKTFRTCLSAGWSADEPGNYLLCLVSFKTPKKLTCFNRPFWFYQLTVSPADSCLMGKFPSCSTMPDNYSYKYFYYGIPQYHSVERHKDKEQNKNQFPLLLDSTETACEWYLQAPKQMTHGLLGVWGKRDKEFWKDGDTHIKTRAKQGKWTFFIASWDTVYRCKGTWHCFLQHKKDF